jgi:hypothetical protein
MGVMLERLLCSACFVYTSIGRLQGATLGGLLRPLQLLASLLCKSYFEKVTWHAQSLEELTTCEANFVRLALCVLNLGTPTLQGLLYVYFDLCKDLC